MSIPEDYDDESDAELDAADQVENASEEHSGHVTLEPQPLSHQVFGTAAVYFGALLLLIAGCETFGGQLNFLPRFWYVNRTLWIGFGFLLIPAGIMIQSRRTRSRPIWKPTRLGRRFERIRVYSRADCHLCDDAKQLLTDPQYSPYLPNLEEVDIDSDPELKRRFGELIPVVEVDGKIRFTGRVDEILLRRLIEGTHPTTLECHRPQ